MGIDAEKAALLKANLAALSGHANPELLAAIGELAETGQVPPPQGMPADPAGRRDLAANALRQYRDNPSVFTFNTLRPIPGANRLSDQMVQEIFEKSVAGKALDESIVPDHGPLICFGIGAHIGDFLADYPTRDLFVIDPNIGAFCADMAETDWRPIVAEVERRGGAIEFVWSDDPIVLAHASIELIRDTCFGLIDGSRLVMGYRNKALGDAASAFMERRESLIAYNGYVEDEGMLFRQAFRNLAWNAHHLLDRDSGARPAIPAIVVGSGASLNADFAALRHARDRACIISCGTALLPLLEHGIRPHMHVELESVPFIADILRFTADRYDLSGIVLGASNTIVPDIAPLFDRRVLCFREGVAATRILNVDAVPLPLIAPACTNTGLRFAYALGFRKIALAGVDLGSRTPESHHADGSVYHHIDSYNAFVGEDGNRIPARGAATGRYDRDMPANFGGTIGANFHMMQMRGSFEVFARAFPDAHLINCSDGAAISGFEPRRMADLLDPKTTEDPVEEVLDRCLAQLPLVQPGDLIDRGRVEAFDAALETWKAKAKSALEHLGRTTASYEDLYAAFAPLFMVNGLTPNSKDVWDSCRYANTGTYMKAFHFVRYAMARMNPDDASAVMQTALAAIDKALDISDAKHLHNSVRICLEAFET